MTTTSFTAKHTLYPSMHEARDDSSKPVHDQSAKTGWKRVLNSGVQSASTQKVRGMYSIFTIPSVFGHDCAHMKLWKYASVRDLLSDTQLILDFEGICEGLDSYTLGEMKFPVFARPCPVTPRHGFVDSRLVHNARELLEIATETFNADPDGELLVTPFIPADDSAVLTPTTLSVGAGHEGATSGKSTTVYGPGPSNQLLGQIRKWATILDTDVPYVEYVGITDLLPVQVRGGPEQVSCVDYVPEDVEVKVVLVAKEDTDLMQWEKDIANAKKGTIVYADGLSLASHFCVHAVVHKVPVLTSYRPCIADLVKATDVPTWEAADWRRLARYFTEADRVSAGHMDWRSMARLSVVGLHCAGTPAPATDAQLRMLAYGAVGALKCVGAACLGEARHMDSNSNTRLSPASSDRLQKGAERVMSRARVTHTLPTASGRDAYYARGAKASLESWIGILTALGPVYRHRKWSSSYGGPAWGYINAGAKALAINISKFRKAPSAYRWALLVTSWNQMIHREHNGKAPALSKFCVGKADMDEIARWPLVGLVKDMSPGTRAVVMKGPDALAVENGKDKIIIPPRKSRTDYVRVKIKVEVSPDGTMRRRARETESGYGIWVGQLYHPIWGGLLTEAVTDAVLTVRVPRDRKIASEPVLTLARILSVEPYRAEYLGTEAVVLEAVKIKGRNRRVKSPVDQSRVTFSDQA